MRFLRAAAAAAQGWGAEEVPPPLQVCPAALLEPDLLGTVLNVGAQPELRSAVVEQLRQMCQDFALGGRDMVVSAYLAEAEALEQAQASEQARPSSVDAKS